MKKTSPTQPLAELLRPQILQDIVGQDHLLAPHAPLGKMLSKGFLSSLILWGPPGCGKTTLARVLAKHIQGEFLTLSAVFSGVGDLKGVFEQARQNHKMGLKTILFVDEIHRFNRAQQDSFLGPLEEGLITLIGATTENPSFELNPALLSRMRVVVLKRLTEIALEQLLEKAEDHLGHPLPLTSEARELLKNLTDGDGRSLLHYVELLAALELSDEHSLNEESLLQLIDRRAPIYDKGQESHYNLISALHKSLRGSDTDAALYWLCRMLEGGEDPKYILRRLIRFASEDIGLADPQALTQALAADQSYRLLGSPEGDLALAHCVIYLSTAPKSNAAYVAFKQARVTAKKSGSVAPPSHILNAPTKLMKDLGYGQGYQYDHDLAEGFSGQNYFPTELQRQTFYHPKAVGFEREIEKRLNYWQKLREKKTAVTE